jgi:class 3 adenylate cyclase
VSTETVAVLFTDLVGSTELLTRVGEEHAEELRREHFRVLRTALAEREGREVKNLGDGIMAVFANASAAVACAVRMQQRIDARNRRINVEPLAIKIGVGSGECDVEDGDYFGPPVVEAARLCAQATGGQILATELVRALAGTRGGYTFEPLGPVALKGFPDPVPVVAVAWSPIPLDAEGSTIVPLPLRLEAASARSFVGRAHERASLAEALKHADASAQRQVVLISGEAGIGKTYLAAEVAREAYAGGAVVLYGRCDEELGVPYQPWAEALRHLVLHVSDELLAEHVTARGGELARLVPELTSRVDALPEPRSGDPETERYLLFGAVLGLLEAVSTGSPVVIVLDDLHWADKPTLLLLRHVVATPGTLRVLVIGTYRATDLGTGHPLTDVLAALHREEGIERVELAGLGDREVVDLVETAVGHDLDRGGVALAHALYRETDGNPFFTNEILRHLVETGALAQDADGVSVAAIDFSGGGLPSSAREVIGRRVARLGQGAEQVLRAAAVMGRDFDLALLGQVTDVGEDALLDVMDAASASALINEVADVPDRFTFSHALVEHTLYEDLSGSRRARLHRRVAEALEGSCGDDPGERVSELAYHWARATAPKEPVKAIEYARQAGDRALASLAPDDALRWYRQALELLDEHDPDEVRGRCALLVRVGDAARQAGDPSYRETLLDAARRAQAAEAMDLVVQAALANSRGFFSAVGHPDEERISVLESALGAIGEPRSAERARLLALLAQELVPTGNLAQRRQLSDHAVEIAREVGDAKTLLEVLNLRFNAILAPETLDERLAVSAEAVQLAEGAGDPVARHFAETFRVFAALDAGDRDELDRAAATAIELADAVGQPVPRWVATWERALLAWLDGDLERTEQHATDALTLGFESGQPDAALVPGVILLTLRWAQGRADELEGVLLQFVADTPGLTALKAAVGVLYSEYDRLDEAREALDAKVAEGFENHRDDAFGLAALVLWSYAIADVGHVEAARLLLPDLLPHRDQFGGAAVVVMGSVATAIGALQTVLGDFAAAEDALQDGLAACERLRSPYLLALTQCAFARLLLRRDEAGDRDRARGYLDDATELAQRYGFEGVERRVHRLALSSSSPSAGDAPAT